MKQILVYLHPRKAFDNLTQTEIRIQIDNFYRLGIKPSDVMLITNFRYSYNGFAAMVVDDNLYCECSPVSTNTTMIPHLFNMNLIHPDELYWVHDLEAFQQYPIWPVELELEYACLGLTTYGWSHKWNMGSYFFTYEAEDIFVDLAGDIYLNKETDEISLLRATEERFIVPDRYKALNITYNFGMRRVEDNYKIATKPVKVTHFHVTEKLRGVRILDIFVRGKNGLGIPLVSEGFIDILKEHGIK